MKDIANLFGLSDTADLCVQGPLRVSGIGINNVKTEFEVHYYGKVTVRYPCGDELDSNGAYDTEVFYRIDVTDKTEGRVAGFLDFLIERDEIHVIGSSVNYRYDDTASADSIVSAAYAKLYGMLLSGKSTKKLVVLSDDDTHRTGSRHYVSGTGSMLLNITDRILPMEQPDDSSDIVYH